MAVNPMGTQNVVGNLLTCSDLLNVATTSNPAATGSGLAASGAYVAGSVAFTSTAVSNVYQMPYALGLVLLVSLSSGTASSFSINTGSAATNCTAVANTGVITDTKTHAVFVAMPSAALGTSQPGAPTAPYVSVSCNIPAGGAQINELALIPLGKLAPGADWVSVRSGLNAVASFVVNTEDLVQPPTNAVGSGSFSISSTQ